MEHKLRDISMHAEAVGMKLNTDKTKLIAFNFKQKQAVPYVSLVDGEPLQCVWGI